jgi:protein-S-isoprenylcysteine O-methyltransferase Ste14
MPETPVRIPFLPPFAFLSGLVAGLIVHWFDPRRLFFSTAWFGRAVGWAALVAGILLMVWADRTLARHGEDSNIRKPTQTLVITGPFAISRNPEYVAFTGMYMGIAFILNAAWPITFLLPVLMFIRYWVIGREERYLEGLFGQKYQWYRARVRRGV